MILLDTHAWIWWIGDPGRLSVSARKAIEQVIPEGLLSISSISTWEVAVLSRKGRLELTMPVEDWIAASQNLPFVQFIPIDNRIALQSVNLTGMVSEDPADRIIIATAMVLGATLVTKDQKLRNYPYVKTLW